jgi:hypothetical protein
LKENALARDTAIIDFFIEYTLNKINIEHPYYGLIV